MFEALGAQSAAVGLDATAVGRISPGGGLLEAASIAKGGYDGHMRQRSHAGFGSVLLALWLSSIIAKTEAAQSARHSVNGYSVLVGPFKSRPVATGER